MARTRIEVSPASTRHLAGLDDLAQVLFPANRLHRRVFIAVWADLKYAPEQFVPSFSDLCARHGFSERVLEIVRARMKRLGILERVSHFSPRYGNRSGWTFSERFERSLAKLADALRAARRPSGRPTDQRKDRDAIAYA